MLKRFANLIENKPWHFVIANVIAIGLLFLYLMPDKIILITFQTVIGFGTTFLAVMLIKTTIKRERPGIKYKGWQRYRMPSHHTASAGCLCTIAYLHLPILALYLIPLLLLTAWSRISTGMHKLDEVVVGALLGSIIAIVVFIY